MARNQNTPPLSYTRIELTKPETGGKHYRWGADNELDKETVGWLSAGRAFVDEATDMADFATVLNTELRAGRDVLTYGVPTIDMPDDGVPLVTKERLTTGTIARSEDHFAWPEGPAILAADYDPRPDHAALSRDDLWRQVVTAVPGYADHDVLWGCSSSSYIFDTVLDCEVVGLKGQRLYMGVEDGTDIPRAAEVLLKRLWLNGFGYILISANGAQLIRATLDPCMYQPSRLDYAAGAVCGEGLEQRSPNAFLISEGLALADTRRVFPDLTSDEEREYTERVAREILRTRDDAHAQREVWADERLEVEARTSLGVAATPRAITAHVTDATQRGRRKELLDMFETEHMVLGSEFVLHLADGQLVTVGDVLMQPSAYEKAKTRDPLEPDYRGGAITGMIFAYGRRLTSHAHGKVRKYILGTDAEYRDIFARRFDALRKLPRREQDTREARISRMMETRLK
ncbi:hypothetical protein NBRC116589_06170 [Ruegeria sp. HU-ET01832]|uniref:hypothetical protein n=1 Tax=Ruegeria sp. HU-ET01832 TaxID=3135906 RepID=UPI00310B38B1